ncbi:hypothetical protein CHS0354_009959, partial [Potamilus streckersoni]
MNENEIYLAQSSLYSASERLQLHLTPVKQEETSHFCLCCGTPNISVVSTSRYSYRVIVKQWLIDTLEERPKSTTRANQNVETEWAALREL